MVEMEIGGSGRGREGPQNGCVSGECDWEIGEVEGEVLEVEWERDCVGVRRGVDLQYLGDRYPNEDEQWRRLGCGRRT
jgi:hypothetical protein